METITPDKDGDFMTPQGPIRCSLMLFYETRDRMSNSRVGENCMQQVNFHDWHFSINYIDVGAHQLNVYGSFIRKIYRSYIVRLFNDGAAYGSLLQSKVNMITFHSTTDPTAKLPPPAPSTPPKYV